MPDVATAPVHRPELPTPPSRSDEPATSTRVCMLIASFRPAIGGSERVVERLCEGLRERGADVVVLTRRHPATAPRGVVRGVPVHRAGYPSRSKLGAITFALHALWLLATSLRAHRTVHVHNLHTPLFVGCLAKVLLRRRLYVTIRSDLEFKLAGWTTGRARLTLVRFVADGVAALTPTITEQLIGLGFGASRIQELPNGVDVTLYRPPTSEERASARARLGLRADDTVYLYVGRLVELKGVDLLLEAWGRLRSQETDYRRRLLLVGDGPEREALETLVARVGARNVRFESHQEDVVTYLHAADAFVLPSLCEGLSNALLEAMATGLAVLVSDHPANRAVVQPGEDGLSFPMDDVQALARGLALLEDLELRQRLGANAVRTIRAGYSVSAMVDRHVRLYGDRE